MRDESTTRRIPLTRGLFALVDDEDYPWLSAVPWFASPVVNTTYARRKPGGYMHRAILNAPEGLEVDHINGNGLDNRRRNLRLVTHRQNGINSPSQRQGTSRYKGVFWSDSAGKWCAQIKQPKSTHLGVFRDEVDAAIAYDIAALSAWGEFAHTNFLRSGHGSL